MEKEKDPREQNGKEKGKRREKGQEKELKSSSSSPSSKKDSGSKKKATKLISDLFGDEHESTKVKKTPQGQSPSICWMKCLSIPIF